MQDSAMLDAKPKLSVVPGTLCFIAAGRTWGTAFSVCHF